MGGNGSAAARILPVLPTASGISTPHRKGYTMTTNARPRNVRHLAEIDAGDLVMVCGIPTMSPSGNGAPRFRVGEVLQCIDHSARDTLVARPDGSRFLVDHALGMEIEVRLFLETNRSWDLDEMWGHDS